MLRTAKIAALVSVVLLLNAVTTLLFVQAKVPAIAQVSGGCIDGDVNGDAGLDISDPIYLLQHLFEGGPAPVACAQGPTAMELEDVFDAVLARYLPRAGEVWDSGHVSVQPGAEQVLLTVPAGKVFEIQSIWGRQEGGAGIALFLELRRNGVRLNQLADYLVLQPNTGSSTRPDRVLTPRLVFQPGDEMTVFHPSIPSAPNYEVWIVGEFYDAP